MIFCHKNEKEITLGADSAQENRGSRAKVPSYERGLIACGKIIYLPLPGIPDPVFCFSSAPGIYRHHRHGFLY